MVDQVMKQKFEDLNKDLEKFTPIKNLVEILMFLQSYLLRSPY